MSVRQIGNKDIYLKFDDSYIEGLFAVQGETGRSYTFTLVDEAGRRINASGYTLSMNIFIDEGVSQSSTSGSSDGRFTIPIRQDMLTRYGKADVQLILSDGTDTLGSLVGSMRIERNLNYDNGKGANLLIDFKEIKQNLAALNSIKGEVNDSINKAVEYRDKSCECATRACECASLAQDGARKAEKIRDEADDIIKSETDRKAEESKRKSAENARASQEDAREEAESARSSAETQRKSQESTRQAEEEKRRSAENARLKEESNRKSEESARKENEAKRLAQEGQRAEAEKDRVSAEDLRRKAEGERKATFEAWDKTVSGDLPPASTISLGVVKLDKVGADTAISKGTFDGFKADLDAKVDKAKDKGLSTNDYTDEAKSKVDAIPDNPKYTDTVYDDADIKSELAGKVDKVTGKELSSNDFTDDYKSKLDALPANPKYTDTTYDLSSYAKKADLKSGLDGKVDKVAGKALSSNDYTDEAKAKVDAIPDDPKYTDTAYDDTEIKEEIVSTKRELGEFIESATKNYAKTSDLTPYVKTADLESYAKRTEIKTKLLELTEDSTHRTVTDTEKTTWNNKVDKVEGKGLSSNDFTNAYKSKLDGIETGATKYTHPSSHPISMISGLQAELDNKIDSYGTNAVLNIAVISAGGSTTGIPNNTLILELE